MLYLHSLKTFSKRVEEVFVPDGYVPPKNRGRLGTLGKIGLVGVAALLLASCGLPATTPVATHPTSTSPAVNSPTPTIAVPSAAASTPSIIASPAITATGVSSPTSTVPTMATFTPTPVYQPMTAEELAKMDAYARSRPDDCGRFDVRLLPGATLERVGDYTNGCYESEPDLYRAIAGDMGRTLEELDPNALRSGDVARLWLKPGIGRPDMPFEVLGQVQTVTVDGLNLRTGPGTDAYNVVVPGYSGLLPVLGRNGDWLQVLYRDGQGKEQQLWVNNMLDKASCYACEEVPVVPAPDPVVALCGQLYRPVSKETLATKPFLMGPAGIGHPGIDAFVSGYTPVLNSTEGTVGHIGCAVDYKKCGIRVDRPDGGTYVTLSHVISPTVTVGQVVPPCQLLAYSYGDPRYDPTAGNTPHFQFDLESFDTGTLITPSNWRACWDAMSVCP